jgi:hypothetical protein
MKPDLEKSKQRLLNSIEMLREKGFIQVNDWVFEKNGIKHDLSAADLEQLERIEKEKLFTV